MIAIRRFLGLALLPTLSAEALAGGSGMAPPPWQVISLPASAVRAVRFGSEETCALNELGQILCWPRQRSCEACSFEAPRLVAGDPDVADFGISGTALCVRGVGGVRCGALGSSGRQTEVVRLDLVAGTASAEHLSMRRGLACIVQAGGAVSCWRFDEEGTPLYPVSPVPEIRGATAVALSDDYACALHRGGPVSCWPVPSRIPGGAPYAPRPFRIDLPDDIVEVAAGEAHFCARRRGGALLCWGRTRPQVLGRSRLDPRDAREPVAVRGISDATQVAAGRRHSCVLSQAQDAICFGEAPSGALGAYPAPRRSSPSGARRTPGGLTALYAGDELTCARTESGGLHCWGGSPAAQAGPPSACSDWSDFEVLPTLRPAAGIGALPASGQVGLALDVQVGAGLVDLGCRGLVLWPEVGYALRGYPAEAGTAYASFITVGAGLGGGSSMAAGLLFPRVVVGLNGAGVGGRLGLAGRFFYDLLNIELAYQFLSLDKEVRHEVVLLAGVNPVAFLKGLLGIRPFF